MDPTARFRHLLLLAADESAAPNEARSSVRAALKMLDEDKVKISAVIPLVNDVSPADFLDRLVREVDRRRAAAPKREPVYAPSPPRSPFVVTDSRNPTKSPAGGETRCGRCGKVIGKNEGRWTGEGYHPNCETCGPTGGSRL